MNIKEFTENVVTLLDLGIYYYGDNNKVEAPSNVKQISDSTIIVEFLNPEDVFMITVERRDDQSKS